jgi:hypothetical protein
MKFKAEFHKASIKTKLQEVGPPERHVEIVLKVNPGRISLDELSDMMCEPVNVEINKIQLELNPPTKPERSKK